MSDGINCLRCRTPMEEGFMTDVGDYSFVQQARWCRGAPNPSFWGAEVQNKQMRQGLRIRTYRCPNCGYLESYAPAPEPTP